MYCWSASLFASLANSANYVKRLMVFEMKATRLFSIVGIFLFAYILMNIDIHRTLEIVSKANLSLIALALLTMATTVTMKSMKWKALVEIYSRGFPLKSALKAWLMGFSLSMVTPARVGDVSRAYYIKQRIGFGKGLATVIIDRVIDIGILFCLAISGLAIFMSFFFEQSGILLIISALFMLFVLAVYASTKKGFVRFLLKPLFKRFVPEGRKSDLNEGFHEFYRGLSHMRKSRRSLLLAVAIGFSAWLMNVIFYYLLCLSIGIDTSYLFLLSVMPIVALLDTLPISFSGLGTRDAALILFFSFAAIGKEYAVSLSFLILVFGYLSIGMAGAALFLREHIK